MGSFEWQRGLWMAHVRSSWTCPAPDTDSSRRLRPTHHRTRRSPTANVVAPLGKSVQERAKCHTAARGIWKTSETNSPADSKGPRKRRRGGAAGAEAEIAQQPMAKIVVRQRAPAAHGECDGGADILWRQVHPWQSMGSPHWSRFWWELHALVDPCWSRFILKDCSPRRRPTLEQGSVRRMQQQQRTVLNCPWAPRPIPSTTLGENGEESGMKKWIWTWEKQGVGRRYFSFFLCFSPSNLMLLGKTVNFPNSSWVCFACDSNW